MNIYENNFERDKYRDYFKICHFLFYISYEMLIFDKLANFLSLSTVGISIFWYLQFSYI